MKRFVCWMGVMVNSFLGFAQPPQLQITDTKTTSLIFPFAIKHVDRGSPDLLVLPVEEMDHILLVKAAAPTMKETNLSVITGDGSVYSFLIRYDPNPLLWVFHLPAQNKTAVKDIAESILDNPKVFRGAHDRKWQIEGEVTGIYVKDEVLYFGLSLSNHSAIDFRIESLRCYIRDQKKAKRTAVQEREFVPLLMAGEVKVIAGHSSRNLVIALPLFTIPEQKYLGISLTERDGGRRLLLKLKNPKLLRALSLP